MTKRGAIFSSSHDLRLTSYFLRPTSRTLPPSLHPTSFASLTPSQVLARDEDYENAFHSSADFTNMHAIYTGQGLVNGETQVMVFDKNPAGPFWELIESAYSKNYAPKRAKDYGGKVVQFSRLVFHLESPAGIVFPKVSGQGKAQNCHDSLLYHGYRHRVLSAFDLWDVPAPRVPTVTLIVRRRTPEKNVGRILADEKALEAIMKECTLCYTETVDLAELSFKEQVRKVRQSNVIIGVHGAGLMNIIFAAEEAVLVEMHPHYRQDRHFRNAARMSGKHYMPLRSLEQVTCKGSSDNVPIDKGEFRETIDGAVRLARSFDDGLSECGLVCSGKILALDSQHDDMYAKLGMSKSEKGNTKFPCH